MIAPSFNSPDYVLAWPTASFLREAGALHRSAGHSWEADVERLLEEAFQGTIPAENFRALSASGAMGRSMQSLHLGQLLAAATAWRDQGAPAPRPRWSQRHGRARTAETERAPDLRRFAGLFLDAVRVFAGQGYFEHAMPTGCDDYPAWPQVDGEMLLQQRLGVAGLWPLYDVAQILPAAPEGEEPDPDLMFDLVEELHDLVARPRTRDWHSFMRHHHYSGFSTATGRELYRAKINHLLDQAAIPLRLADSGEDVGRLVHAAGDDREELVTRALATPVSQDASAVAHALALFRSRSASIDDKRSAIVALARVLEDRRDLLKAELLSKDEGSLFLLANKFDLRHRDATQQGDYDPVFLDWVFWWYLATIELTDRLIARQELM